MNKGFSVLIIMLFMLSSFSVLGAELATDKTETRDSIEPSFWSSIFGGNTFSFVSMEKTSYEAFVNNEVRSWNGPYQYVKDQSTAGTNCAIGDLIVPYVADSNGNWEADIWVDAYVKEYSSDVVNLNDPNYGAWVDDWMNTFSTFFSPRVYYGYICYLPNLEQDRVYSGSRCVLDDTFCSDAFQISGVGAYFCDIENSEKCDSCENGNCIEESENDFIKPAEVKDLSAKLYNVEVNGEESATVIQYQNYEITGTIVIEGKCAGCVVESGVDLYGTTFSVTARSDSGACGDDLTVGAKFSAENENVQFILTDKVNKEPGKYKVPVYVFSACASEGGVLLSKSDFTIIVEPQHEDTLVECYWCDGGSKKSGPFSSCDYAPKDATENSALSCTADKTCYICEDDKLKSATFDDGCVGDYQETEPACGSDQVMCYTCDGDNSAHELKDECVGDWSATPIECANNEVECWAECSPSGITYPQIIDGIICPAGTSLNKPNCDVELNTCYRCYDYELQTDFFENSCETYGLDSVELDCSPTNPVTCHACNLAGNPMSKEYQTSCPDGWSEESVICGNEETCYWCESTQLKSQDYAVCPTGTKDEIVDCSVIVKVDCANQPNNPACQVAQCQAGSDESFCKSLCCDVSGDAKWEYAGLCANPLATSECTGKEDYNDVIIIVSVILGVLALIGVSMFTMKKKR